MKTFRATLIRSLAVLLFAACSVAARGATKQVTFLYANDFHSAIEPMKATWLVDQPPIGGARDFGAWVAMMRESEPNTFLFDSGDIYTGQAISFLTHGQVMVDLWKAIGFDAACLGNHEFDYGIPWAQNYMNNEPFPVLAANLFYKSSGKPFARPYAIIEHNGIRVAAIGVFGPDAAPATLQSTWDTLEVRDPVPILRRLVPELHRRADLVVILAHEGQTGPMQSDAEAHPEIQRDFNTDKALAAAVPGIDVLFGGHAHRGIEVPWVSPVHGTLIVQTYGFGTTLGVLRVKYSTEQHRIVAHSGALVRVMDGVFPVPPKVEAVVEHWEKESARAEKEVVGQAPAALTRNYDGESALGDLMTDAMLWRTHAQIAFENAGGMRGDLPAGPVTRYDVISAFPFVNTPVEMDLTGAQIRAILEQSLTLKVGMLQVAGLHATYDLSRPEYHRLVSAEVAGAPLQDGKTYRVVATSIIATGGDNYTQFLEGKNVHDTGELLCNLLTAYARSVHTLAPRGTGRLREVSH
jgi:2',3'-cyclic-nucleotide 2'-phosphodiesterase (5'-nucleotidase family)